MIKHEIYTGAEITTKWPEVAAWISQCHMLKFEIEFDVVETFSENSEVMEYHDSGIRRVTVEFREFSDGGGRIKDDSRPFDTSNKKE